MPVLSLACHLPHITPHIPSRYNNEQTTKQTKAINNSYIHKYYISCKCDTNRAGHFTLDAYASRPVACGPFVRRIQASETWWRHQMETFSGLLDFPHKGGALMFSLICTWINGWVNNGEASYLRRHSGHYDVIVMISLLDNTKMYKHHT